MLVFFFCNEKYIKYVVKFFNFVIKSLIEINRVSYYFLYKKENVSILS